LTVNEQFCFILLSSKTLENMYHKLKSFQAKNANL